MRERTGSSTNNLLLRLPAVNGFDSTLDAIRRAQNTFFAAPPVLFSRALFANPGAVGALCPSSMKLARALAAQVPLAEGKGLVLELGAGTGRVTEALLEKGVDPARLVVVERDRLLAHYLKNQFENVAVIHGNALKLCELCNRFEREVGCVVSSLPLLSLPPETVDALGQALSRLLGKNGLLIQYTYRLNNQQGPLAPYLERVAARTVIYNIPPARVEIFKARSGQAGE